MWRRLTHVVTKVIAKMLVDIPDNSLNSKTYLNLKQISILNTKDEHKLK